MRVEFLWVATSVYNYITYFACLLLRRATLLVVLVYTCKSSEISGKLLSDSPHPRISGTLASLELNYLAAHEFRFHGHWHDWPITIAESPRPDRLTTMGRRLRRATAQEAAQAYRLEGTSFSIASKGRPWRFCCFGSPAET
jgi:hypothetical protein